MNDQVDSRQIRIFISSTFKDMEIERNYLLCKIFPRLRLMAEKRNVSIIPIDLRWGITEEESKTGKVVEICLQEIENSHPFFIGIIGNRYGWCPSADEVNDCIQNEKYQWLTDDILSGLSITEIEMQYGVLRNPLNINAYFYLLNDEINGDSIENKDKLLKLKNTIIKNGRYPVSYYKNPKDLGAQIELDFVEVLNRLYPETETSFFKLEYNAQKAFIREKCRIYIDRFEDYEVLNNFVESRNNSNYFVLIGNKGVGKSSLLANWLQKFQIENESCNTIYFFVEGGNLQGNCDKILTYLYNQIIELYNLQDSIIEDKKNISTEDLEKLFYNITNKKKLLIVLDGINYLADYKVSRKLHWLPYATNNIKFILSTIPNEDDLVIYNNRNYQLYYLLLLDKNVKNRIIDKYLSQYRKGLTKKQYKQIIENNLTDNTLVLRTFLDELIVTGRFQNLNESIDYYLTSTTCQEFYLRILQRFEKEFGKEDVQNILSLIAFSHIGLTENEIIDMSAVSRLWWSQFYSAYHCHLTIKNGMICFSSIDFRMVILTYYNDCKHEIYSKLINYFGNSSSWHSMVELPYCYSQINDYDDLYKFLLNFSVCKYYFENDIDEFWSYWKYLLEVNNYYSFLGYLDLPIENVIENAGILNGIGWFIKTYSGNFLISIAFHKKAIEILSKTTNGSSSIYLSESYGHIGHTYIQVGKYYDAEINLKKALKIANEHPKDRIVKLLVASIYGDLSELYNLTDSLDSALSNFKEACNIYEDIFNKDNAYIASLYNTLGVINYKKGDFNEALKNFDYSTNMFKRLQGDSNVNLIANYLNLSDIYGVLDEMEKSEFFCKKAEDLVNVCFCGEHPVLIQIYTTYGKCYFRKGSYDKSIEYFNNALEISIKIYGKNHPTVASVYYNLGYTYRILCKFEKAIEFYQKGIETSQLCNKKSLSIAEGEFMLGDIYSELDQYYKAFQLEKKALRIAKDISGDYHFIVINSLGSIGLILLKIGKLKFAIKFLKQTLALTKKVYGDNHHCVAVCYNNLGLVYSNIKDSELAFYYLNKALEINKNIYGELKDSVAQNYMNIGDLYSNTGEYNRAIEYYNKTLDIYENIYSGDSNISGIAVCYNNIAYAYSGLNNNELALGYYQKAMFLNKEIYGENHSTVAQNCSNIACVYSLLGNYEDSLTFHIKALEINKTIDLTMVDMVNSINNVGCAYYNVGEYERSLKYHQEALIMAKTNNLNSSIINTIECNINNVFNCLQY